MKTQKFQVQARWETHRKGPEFWQKMNGLFISRESAEAHVAKYVANGWVISEYRIVEKA